MHAKRCTLLSRVSLLVLAGCLGLGGSLAAQYYGVEHHIHINDNCYICGYPSNSLPTAPGQQCIAVPDGQEGMGTSCSDYVVGDAWICQVTNNPCYNAIVHASLTTGGPAEGNASRDAVAAAQPPACLRISSPMSSAQPAR